MRLTAYRSPAHRCGDDLTRCEAAAGMVDALIVMEARRIVSLIIMLQLHMLLVLRPIYALCEFVS
jgi:hypothetical protein